MVVGGVAGGALGFLGGVLIVPVVMGCSPDDNADCLRAMLISGGLGASTLLPFGVHEANGRQGNYLLGGLYSLALGGAALWAFFETDVRPPVSGMILVGVPLAQIAGAISIERATARKR